MNLGQVLRTVCGRIGAPIFGAALIIGVLAAISVAFFGGPARGIMALRGESLVVRPATLDIGAGYEGEERMVSFAVENFGRAPMKIVGGTSDCTCVATEGLPLHIAPGTSEKFWCGSNGAPTTDRMDLLSGT